jgi:CubicO group peptidase (beta-lactamase class C family)
MINFRKILSIFLIVTYSASVHAQKIRAEEKIATESIDAYMRQKLPANSPGAALLITKGKNVIVRSGYGLANIESKSVIKPETIFRIGSITKQFTSTAILQLASQGKLMLDDEISKFLTDYPSQGKTITIRHLLTHTSGIKSYTSIPEVMTRDGKARNVAVAEMINVFKNKPMDFNPGEDYRYNNSGYYLLGAIVEKVSGVSWQEYVKKNFFEPLEMQSTFAFDSGNKRQATGYTKNSDVADYVHPTVPYSAGAIFSTVDDLWKWNQAIFNYKIVKKEWLDMAWTPVKLNNGREESYGFGWKIGRLNDLRVIGHSGGIDGFVSYSLYVPDLKLFVALLLNNVSQKPDEIAYYIAYLASGKPAVETTAMSMPEAALDEYTGVYEISEKESYSITRQGSQLFSQRPGEVKVEIVPHGNDDFFIKEQSNLRYKFLRGADKKIISLEIWGRDYLIRNYKRTDKP